MFAVLPVISVSAQSCKMMREVWVTMPDSIVPYLNHELRVELADYWEMKAEAKVKNLLGNETRLTNMSDKFMALQLNVSTDAAIRLLSCGDSTYIICMVKTLKAPAAESDIRFYTSDWKQLSGTFGLPTVENAKTIKHLFTEKRDTMTVEFYNKLCDMIEPIILEATLSENDEMITFELSLPFLTDEEKDETSLILMPRKYYWDGKMFKKC